MAAFPSDKHGFSQTGLVGAVGVGLVAALTAMPLWASDQDNTRATARSERQESRAAASSERASSAPSSSAPSTPSTTPQSTPSYSAPSSGSSSSSEPSTPVYTRSAQAPQRSESSPSAGRGGSVYIHEGGNGSTPSVQVASDRGGRDGGRDRGGRGNGGRDRDRHRGGHRGGGHHGGGIYIGGYGGGYGGYGYYPGYCRWCWGGYPWGGGTIIVEGGGGGYGYGGNTGALDLDVAPERAEVYINGDYAGRADDYDGWPAFLWLEAGTYDIVLYHEGYRTIARQYTVRPGVVIDVQDEMQQGDAVRPEDLPSRSTVNRDERVRRNEERDAEVTQRERDNERRSARVEAGSDRPETEQAVGRIYLSLWPDDAAVYLDGHFLGTAGEISQLSAGLVVEPGEHRLEVVHPGFKTEQRTVNVPSGERVEVKFDLTEN